jgi:hypothetical protein
MKGKSKNLDAVRHDDDNEELFVLNLKTIR